MSETFYIHDMEIRFEYNPTITRHSVCHITLMKISRRFRFIDDDNCFRIMCTYMGISYSADQIYRELIKKNIQ